MGYKPVEVKQSAFIGCRYSIMVLLWLSYFFRLKELVYASFIILLLSAIFGVRRAPMILLFSSLFFFSKKTVMLDEKGMRFAHGLGSVLGLICSVMLFTGFIYAWGFVLMFCIMKSISALGFCPGEKLYSCMTGGSCCRFLKHAR